MRRHPLHRILALVLLLCAMTVYRTDLATAAPGDIQTFAGGAGTGLATSIGIYAYVIAADGDQLFIPDLNWAVVRRVDLTTGQSVIVAGTGAAGYSGDGGPATLAQVETRGIAVDAQGNLFLTESSSRIRRIDALTGTITTVAGTGAFGYGGDGGPATAAQIGLVVSTATDAGGNLFLADFSSNRIRRVDVGTGIITTIAGTGASGGTGDGGPATAATMSPQFVAVDPNGDVFVAGDRRIRKIDMTTGIISTIAGTGSLGSTGDGGLATAATITAYGMTFDASGNLFVVDIYSDRVRRIDAGTGVIDAFAGNGTSGYSGDGGPATAATFNDPWSVALDASGNVLICDNENRRVRRVVAGTIDTVAGNGTDGYGGDGGPASAAQIWYPGAIAFDSAGNIAIGDVNAVRRIDAQTKVMSTFAGDGQDGFAGDGGPGSAARTGQVDGVAFDPADNLLFTDTFHHRIRRVDHLTGIVTTIAGDGTAAFGGDGGLATAAQLNLPTGLLVEPDGDVIVADYNNARLRRIDAVSGVITTIAGTGTLTSTGDGGLATAATIAGPLGLARDSLGNLYVSELNSHRVRKINASTGNISTVAGGGSGDGEGVPPTSININTGGIAVDATGNLFIADPSHHRVRRVDVALGTIATYAGTGTAGYAGDGGPATAALLNEPRAVYVDANRNVYVGESGSHRVRRIAGPFVTCGDGVVQPGVEECDDNGTASNDGCDANCKIEQQQFEGTPSAGGTVNSDPGNEGATPAKPVQAAVTTPTGGQVTIQRDGIVGTDVGYRAVGGHFAITAPDESVETPLQLVFRLDASLIPPGEDENTLLVSRDTVPIDECDPDFAGQAVPDPCISSRVRLAPDPGQTLGDVVITVLSSHASDWAFATDACGAMPANGCLKPVVAGKAQLQVKEPGDPAKDAISWKWAAGAETQLPAFGAPDTATDYDLCVYDYQSGTPVRRLHVSLPHGGLCKDKPCWKGSTSGWQYKKGDFVPKGQLQLKLKSGIAGKAQIAFKGQGPQLGLSLLPLSKDPSVRVQLNNTNGTCWEATYSTSSKSDAGVFQAKSD